MADPGSAEIAVAATGLTKQFGAIMAVAGIDLSISRGEIFGFLGPNGSGKTTLLRMLCGLLPPDSGTGHSLGVPFSAPPRARRQHQQKIGYLAQRFTLYDDLSIEENLQFRARIFFAGNHSPRVSDALDTFGLRARRHQLAGTLSGGWRRRLELAACLLHEPQLVLLDEPTAGVDADARNDFWDEIQALTAKGVTALVSTHDVAEAERCHRIGCLWQGRLAISGTPADLIRQADCSAWWLDGRELPRHTAGLGQLPGVVRTELRGNRLRLIGRNGQISSESLSAFAATHDLSIATTTAHLDDALAILVSRDGR